MNQIKDLKYLRCKTPNKMIFKTINHNSKHPLTITLFSNMETSNKEIYKQAKI